jgi:hypothetical protein
MLCQEPFLARAATANPPVGLSYRRHDVAEVPGEFLVLRLDVEPAALRQHHAATVGVGCGCEHVVRIDDRPDGAGGAYSRVRGERRQVALGDLPIEDMPLTGLESETDADDEVDRLFRGPR